MGSKPLQGITVVELGTYVAIPTCGRMLMDLGAHVIKVEGLGGDLMRIQGANWGIKGDEGENPLYDLYNTGKDSIALNVKTETGRDVMARLLERADVFISNIRSKSLRKLGLDWETLHEKYPTLVYAFLSGYGEKGPECEEPGFDSTAFWTKTGFLADMVREENSYPVQHPTSVGDTVAATLLFGGITAALYERKTTGVGELVSTSLYGTGIWYMGSMITMAQRKYGGDKYPKRIGANGALREQYRCADGEWLMVMIIDEEKYAFSFFDALGRNDLRENPDYNTLQARRLHKKELFDVVRPIMATKTCEEWLKELKSRDIPCTRVNHFVEVPDSEQAWANGYLEEEHFPNGTTGVIPCMPLRFSGEQYHTFPAQLLGESTEKVLHSLGYTNDEIAEMLRNKVAAQHE